MSSARRTASSAFTSLYGGDRITYTVVVSNTGNTSQDVLISGHLPADSELAGSNGSALQGGGAYGAGFVTLDVPMLAGGASTELVWSVKTGLTRWRNASGRQGFAPTPGLLQPG